MEVSMVSHMRVLVLTVILSLNMSESFAIEVPTLVGRVNDYAKLLTDAERRSLEERLTGLENETGAQVAILTVPNLQQAPIDVFSLTVAEKWKLGQKGKDNGILILYTKKEDRYRIEVGYGLEGAIPDGRAGEIIRKQLRGKANPKKGTHDFAGAFTDAVGKISSLIASEHEAVENGATIDSEAFAGLFILACFVAGLFGIFHLLLGGVVGAVEGFAFGFFFFDATIFTLFICTTLGFIIGILVSSLFGNGGGGRSGSDASGGWFFSGSSSGDGFSGGGGGFGGGGAGD
jgi:uncharacterized protein